MLCALSQPCLPAPGLCRAQVWLTPRRRPSFLLGLPKSLPFPRPRCSSPSRRLPGPLQATGTPPAEALRPFRLGGWLPPSVLRKSVLTPHFDPKAVGSRPQPRFLCHLAHERSLVGRERNSVLSVIKAGGQPGRAGRPSRGLSGHTGPRSFNEICPRRLQLPLVPQNPDLDLISAVLN